MDLKNIYMSIFSTLMGALLKYLLLVLRTIANMSARDPIIEHCPRRSDIWRHNKMHEHDTDQQILERRGEDGKKGLLNNLQPEPLTAMYSLQLMADVVSQVQTALNRCACVTSPKTPNDTMAGIYFFVDMQPQSHRNCFNSSIEEFEPNLRSSDRNNNADEMQMFERHTSPGSQIAHCNTEVRLKPCQRQRTISECSEDSFICFEENSFEQVTTSDDEDNYDDADATINQCECRTDNTENMKKVRFNLKPKIHVMHTWDYAYRAARKGDWQVHARDRVRFRQRIQRVSEILDPILNTDHRQQVYKDRFSNIK